jgi:subtilase family serine protease
MANKKNFGLTFACLLLASLGVSGSVAAQAPALQTTSVLGVAPSSVSLDRMILLLEPPADRRQALLKELADQRNPASPEYRHWLTPAAFADAYANSAADVDRVSAWLASEGFKVAPLPAGRGWIEFSGSVAQVEQAFRTRVVFIQSAPGETRAVLASAIVVPGAIKPLVHGLVSLDGTLAAPAITPPQTVSISAADLASQTSLNHVEALSPQMLAHLLHLDGLHTAGTLGTGQSIAIPARSNVRSSDIAAFRTAFSLSASALQVASAGPDPGPTADEPAAVLAASWAGVAAPGANIILVPAATTAATDGLDLALAAIVDQVLAHTVTVGYSSCEAGIAEPHQAFYAALYRQAAAEGLAVIAASGDSGASACHMAGTDAPVTTGFAVNALASTPWNTAVGVAAFGAAGPQAGIAALSAWSPLNPADPGFAGGGGTSALYSAPGWQATPSQAEQLSAASGTSGRLVPDLALPTALDRGVNPGLAFCFGGVTASTGCTLVRSGGSAAASAIFAGIVAMVAERDGAQGNVAPYLYAFGSHTGIFTDVQQGNAQLPCTAGTPGCGATQQIGFAAAAGYDLATGLGTPDAQKLVNDWDNPAGNGTAVATVTNTITAGQTINPSGSVVLSASVDSGTAGSAPTGTIAFLDQSNNNTVDTVLLVPGTGGLSTASVTVTGVLTQGGHPIVAEYSGDTVYAAANSQPVVVEVQPSSTVTVVTPANSNPGPGSSLIVTALVTSSNAGSGAQAPSGTMDFRLDGVSQGIQPLVAGVPAANSTNSTSSIGMTMPYVAGNHQIVGFYSGDTNYTNSTSAAAVVTLASSAPTVVLTPATLTPLAGSNLQLTVTISPPSASATAPTGTVSITLDGSKVATVPVTASSPSSTATATITAPAIGTHILVATYSGDANYSVAASPAVTITVGKTATTLVVTPATTTPAANSPLLLTATLTPVGTSAATPSGTISFTLDGATQGTAPIASGTTATFTITAPASGSHTVQATYGGDVNFASSVAPAVSITVAKTATTVVISPLATTPTAGGSLAVTAVITPSTAGSTLPSGNVTFTLDGVNQGVAAVTTGSPSTATLTITVPTSGTHTLVAAYSGDTYYATATSPGLSFAVAKAVPTVVVTAGSPNIVAGAPLQLSATIAPPASGGAAPTGTVTFLIDGASVGIGAVSSGTLSTASVTITAPAVGSHTLQASYSGDTNYTAAVSTANPITVGKSTTTLALTPSTTTPLGGNTLQATATLTAAIVGTSVPTGTVTFTLDGATQGIVPISGTLATMNITAPATGSHTLQATYSGDSNYTSSVSSPVIITVAKTSTTTVVTPATNAPALGSALPVTATITPATTGATPPTGIVTFTLDGTTAGVVAVASGFPATAGMTLPALSPGTHALAANYSGDTYYAASTAAATTITVAKSPTTLSVIPASTSPAAGGSLQVTATLLATSPGTSLPTGTVTFTLDGVSAGVAALVSGNPSTATATLTSLTPGTHLLAATYSGDSYYGISTASGVSLTVGKGTTTTTLTPASLTPTAGSSMVVTASISSPNPGATQPGGTVSVSMDGAVVGTGTVTAGSPSTASVTIPMVSAGSHILQATYSGDVNYTGSTSSSVTIVAAKGATVVTLTATPPALAPGVTETLTATLAPLNAVTGTTYTITGTVTFYDGGTVLLGTATVAANVATLTGVKLANNVAHSITAIYSGDTNWLPSTSAALPLAATTLPDTVTLTSNYSATNPEQAVVLTATVTPNATPVAGSEQNPTGTVVFYNGTTIIGQAALVANPLTDTSTATLTIQTLPGGMDTLSAVYLGDLYYDEATSNLLSLTIQGFTIAPSSSNPATNLNIVQGSAGSADFVIAGTGGFNNEVQVVCSVPTQDDMTCTATPQQVVPTATVTFVVQTFASGHASSTTVSHNQPFWPRAAGGAALAFLGFFLLPMGRRARLFAGRNTRRFWILLLLLVGLGSTGIGCTSVAGVASGGTPLGVATLKITASAYVDNTVVSQSVYLTVNVLAQGTTAP